ncbi:MAG: phosphomannomutase [Deltaproteobacteria bacterium RIFOXYA12_FULL_61_11]|nr:MAG: phosphomannomutase [Deltaproteobacteria bacterium RIFOXYA12_FULL_61_11]
MPAHRSLDCFKAYDVRGRVPDQLDVDLARDIGRAYATFVKPSTVVVGRDIRLTSEAMTAALTEGLVASGCKVHDIGLCGTEMVYFATAHLNADGGIMVTASHNPKDYNGMKFVREGARPISGDTGLETIRSIILERSFAPDRRGGSVERVEVLEAFIHHLLQVVRPEALTPLRLVVNPGNGCAGPVLEALAPRLPVHFLRSNFTPDGTFPNGVPNPLLPENREATAAAVRAGAADLGIAWDGDYDRCFFYDHTGAFVDGYYIVGFLAEAMLRKHGGGAVVLDPRLTWNTLEVLARNKGRAVISKSGHAFIKERMRAEDAVYGGEMSAHHYFREFFYCDSGMLPWLLLCELVGKAGRPLADLLAESMEAFPISGEQNRTVADPQRALALVKERYAATALASSEVDGISLEFAQYRFNLRMSNTEPVIRLNVETRGDRALCDRITAELLSTIEGA